MKGQLTNRLALVLVMLAVAGGVGAAGAGSVGAAPPTVPWFVTGNAGTNPATNFLGTTDNLDLVVRTNNLERLRITSAGNVGIGTTAPGAKLQVLADGIALYGQSTGTSGTGVYGEGGLGTGVYGNSVGGSGVQGNSPYDIGVQGDSTFGIGVRGNSDNYIGVAGGSASGYGVYGTSSTGDGVRGQSTGTGHAGYFVGNVYVTGNLYSGNGVDAEGGTGNGVFGHSSGAAGVRGQSSSGYGVRGTSSSGYGVSGEGGTGTGVYGNSDGGFGVFGNSDGGFGVGGQSTFGVGVFGNSTTGGYAGLFNGNVLVTGNLSKGGGSFKIDDPLDPENKYLYHSFVESPDMMDVYNGNVILDSKGEAIVTMPDYFGALNRDFRYQLTPIGAPGPNLYIAEEIVGNHFKIAGGKPGSKVSWQVTGIRQDPYANAHRIPVEEEKPADERGKYLHPTEWGQPESKGVDYERMQRLEQRNKQAPGK